MLTKLVLLHKSTPQPLSFDEKILLHMAEFEINFFPPGYPPVAREIVVAMATIMQMS